MTDLVILDLDGTIVVEPKFYTSVYSQTLEDLVLERKGPRGVDRLQACRAEYSGKGELVLFELNIPFSAWAEKLMKASLEYVNEQSVLVDTIGEYNFPKVVYTGSPLKMATRLLKKIGFKTHDLNEVIGWENPELYPIKWGCSPLSFEFIMQKFNADPKRTWSVGDNWQTDCMPAQAVGMQTALICRNGSSEGNPDLRVNSLYDFLQKIKE